MVVGILEDNILFRKSLENFLTILGDYFISFSEGDFSSITEMKQLVQPDIILLDIHLDDVNGVNIMDDLKSMFPQAQIIMITGDTSDEFIMRSVQNGASGYLFKPFTFDDFRNSLINVQENGSFMQPEVLTKLLNTIRLKPDSIADLKRRMNLSDREIEIMDLIKDGLLYKEVAEALKMSYHTVNHHLKNIYLKFNVNSRAQLVAKYLKSGGNPTSKKSQLPKMA